jgi:hypothetical protein
LKRIGPRVIGMAIVTPMSPKSVFVPRDIGDISAQPDIGADVADIRGLKSRYGRHRPPDIGASDSCSGDRFL